MTSQIGFDEPPLYDDLINFLFPKQMADIWINYWASFYQTLISYLSPNGIFLPNLTQDEIDSLQTAALVNGQFLYNITIDAPQFWQISSMSWRTVSFT